MEQLDLQEDEHFRITVTSNISLTDCKFKGTFSFSYTNFKAPINLNGAHFEGATDFSNAHFEGDADFSNVHFEGATDFHDAHFERFAFFDGSRFEGDASFDFAHFEYVDFHDVQFKGSVNFDIAHFERDSIFKGAYFKRNASFVSAHFERFAFFDGARFEGDVVFNLAQFDKRIQFGSVRERTIFDKSLFLDNCKIYSMYIDADFRGSYRKQISLRYPDLTNLFVPWKSIKDHIRYADSDDSSAYLAIIKNYNNLGWFEDADQCIYQYRTVRRKEHLDRIHWVFDCIPWLFYGYGVRYYYPLIGMLGILVIFAIFYAYSGQAQFPGVLGLSIIILTATTQIGSLTGFCWYLSIIERVSRWLLMATFLVALAKKTLR